MNRLSAAKEDADGEGGCAKQTCFSRAGGLQPILVAPMLQRPRKSWRLQSALAVVAGVGLLAFEMSRIQQGDKEAYFWAFLAGLMILLGIAGVFALGGDGEN
jgi:hypothetical protein